METLWIGVDNSTSVLVRAGIHRLIPNRVTLWITRKTSDCDFFRVVTVSPVLRPLMRSFEQLDPNRRDDEAASPRPRGRWKGL